MRGLVERTGLKVLLAIDPERAHELSIAALRSGFVCARQPASDPRLAVTVAGLDFPNPLGMAAGFDKNAEVPDRLIGLGFGFAEAGTVTPRPQSGNPRPRIFRLRRDRAVINRLGFNNAGMEACRRKLVSRAGRGGIVGINVGANKDSDDRIADYVTGIETLGELASYVTVNISSPNTPGLRDLQGGDSLPDLLKAVSRARASITSRRVPIFLKIAPDLDMAMLENIVGHVVDHEIDGMIVSNTTLSRDGLSPDPAIGESGGLSGRPLFERSTAMLARARRIAGGKLPLIGLGGIDSTGTALEKIRAGADLVQLYTGMIYHGPGLPARIVAGMSRYLDEQGIGRIGDLRDTRLDDWADRAF